MKKTVLLLYTNYSTFVAKDKEILEENYQVISYEFKLKKKLFAMLWELIKEKLFILWHIWKVDFVYSWFSDFHSFLPFLFGKLLGKKTIVIVGGFDAVSIPELHYGLFHKKNIRQYFGKWTYQLSDFILPVDASLIKSTNYYADPKGLKVGVKNYVPGLKATIKSIPLGYDPNEWYFSSQQRTPSVLAYGYAGNMQKFVGKGFDFLIDVARKMPDVKFHLVSIHGEMKEYALKIAPPNVKITDSLRREELLKELAQHKVYALLSMSEGLPSSLCEAMLCGCVPVASNVGAIENIMGECGFLLKNKDIDIAVKLIRKALSTAPGYTQCGRKRIADNFSIERRKKELFKLMDS